MAKQPRLCRFQSLGPHGFHDIAYTEWGNPNAPRLVFCVHGFTRNARDFDALAESLADSCHVVCMDVAGRGQSEWLTHKGDYAFGLYLNDAAALLARVTAPAQTSRLRRMLGGGQTRKAACRLGRHLDGRAHGHDAGGQAAFAHPPGWCSTMSGRWCPGRPSCA